MKRVKSVGLDVHAETIAVRGSDKLANDPLYLSQAN